LFFVTQPEGAISTVVNVSDNQPLAADPAIDTLESRIAAARQAENARMAREHPPVADARGMGIQVASTLLGYPLGGIVIGLVLDNIIGTLPWITIGLMFLAFAGACMQVMRLTKNSAK